MFQGFLPNVDIGVHVVEDILAISLEQGYLFGSTTFPFHGGDDGNGLDHGHAVAESKVTAHQVHDLSTRNQL